MPSRTKRAEEAFNHHGVKIIENTEEAKNRYGSLWGRETRTLTRKEIDALIVGKCLAWNDGEYVQFVVMENAKRKHS